MGVSNDFRYSPSRFLPYRDAAVCARVRAIKKEELCRHPNANFKMSVVEDLSELYLDYALDMIAEIQKSLEDGRRLVLLLPARVSPYAPALINALRIPMRHVHTFNMDEYADEDGNSAPASWPGSYQRLIRETFFNRIDEELRPPADQIHFPSKQNINDYGRMIEDLGGIDVCYGQVGWNGHLAYFEPELGEEFGDDLEAFKKAGPCIVEISLMTVMQNSLLFARCGDWAWHPPKAVTIGPAQVVGSKRNSWRQWGYIGNGISWQRFIVRLVAHGPVTPLVPATILQTLDTDFKILGAVAENCESPV